MKKGFKILLGILFVYFIFVPMNFVFSQDMPGNELSAETQNEETSTFSYGTVVSVNEHQIVVSEYDYEKDEEVENTYVIDQKTEIKGVNAISEIAVDDNVDIVYVTVDGKKIAQSIAVEKPTEDEDPPAETDHPSADSSSNDT